MGSQFFRKQTATRQNPRPRRAERTYERPEELAESVPVSKRKCLETSKTVAAGQAACTKMQVATGEKTRRVSPVYPRARRTPCVMRFFLAQKNRNKKKTDPSRGRR